MMDYLANILTPSLLSLLNAPVRYSRETSSFSLSHCITKGSNQAGYSGTAPQYGGTSFTYSVYNHFTCKHKINLAESCHLIYCNNKYIGYNLECSIVVLIKQHGTIRLHNIKPRSIVHAYIHKTHACDASYIKLEQ